MNGRIAALFKAVLLGIWCQVGLAASLEQLGDIRFPTSASEAAQEHFLAGVAYLHSFGWKQARGEFLRAQQLNPDFAMAFWGESLTYNHPLFPETDNLSPSAALNKLGSSSKERLSKAPSELEKGFLRAVEAYAFTEDDGAARREAYLDSMQNLYQAFPEHEEVRAFYALSLLSVAAQSSTARRDQLRQQAGELANSLFQQNDRHPGAIHYLIHSYDDPYNATRALEAANKYVEIAPIIAHARHMPSHIFIHLGKWYEVADLNETAFYTARALWQPGDTPGDQNHAIEFGQYGDLQLADYEAAEIWIQRAEDTLIQNPDDKSAMNSLKRLKARLIVESKHWQYAAADNDKTNDELFAIGLSAINMRDLALAKEANRILRERAEIYPTNIPLKIAQLEIEASLLFADGDTDASIEVINKAIELTLQNPPVDPLPNPLKPAFELKGEFLLRAGRAESAIEAFTQSLELTPYRPWSVLGIARSYATIGDNPRASDFYRILLESWGNTGLLGVSEAKTHLSIHGGTTYTSATPN